MYVVENWESCEQNPKPIIAFV